MILIVALFPLFYTVTISWKLYSSAVYCLAAFAHSKLTRVHPLFCLCASLMNSWPLLIFYEHGMTFRVTYTNPTTALNRLEFRFLERCVVVPAPRDYASWIRQSSTPYMPSMDICQSPESFAFQSQLMSILSYYQVKIRFTHSMLVVQLISCNGPGLSQRRLTVDRCSTVTTYY